MRMEKLPALMDVLYGKHEPGRSDSKQGGHDRSSATRRPGHAGRGGQAQPAGGDETQRSD